MRAVVFIELAAVLLLLGFEPESGSKCTAVSILTPASKPLEGGVVVDCTPDFVPLSVINSHFGKRHSSPSDIPSARKLVSFKVAEEWI